MRKVHIDRDVALELGASKRSVSRITQMFLHKVMHALIDGHEVTLDNFGRMRLAVQGGAPPPNKFSGPRDPKVDGLRWRVHFKKSEPFKREVRRHAKEYGTTGRAPKRLQGSQIECGSVLHMRQKTSTKR